ncbi:MAG: PKD domain-containing protein [Flavobacteriales bacterium]
MNGYLPAPAAHLRKLLTALFTVALMGAAYTQTITIIDGFAASCSGTLYDSGGDSGLGYGGDEDWTLVLCAESPGQAVRLEWSTFNLAPGDYIEVFDGPDNTAFSFGQLNSGIGGITVQSSYENVMTNGQGCITLHFVSGTGNTGSFVANISCFTPCAPPTAGAIIVGSTVPALVCVGEEVTFDGSSSAGAPGFNVVGYEWNFRDGTTNGTGEVVSHSFAAPGEYNVALTVTDDNNCVNTNVVDVRVRVGTIPNFDGLSVSDTVICQGEEVDLVGVVNSPTWTNVPQPFVEGLTELPDGSGVTYESGIAVSGFTAGTVISDPNDLVSVCIVMEHSFMGDLIVNLTSPNGQEVLLFNGNPGGGTYLGGANNNDDLTPGEGWLYCFQNTAALGTLVEEYANGYTEVAGTNPPSAAMIAGTYTSEESFTGFTGSDLNGTWTLTILDDAFIDDGFIFEWYMNFNPLLYPDIVSFTPVYGPGADSTFWAGPGIISMDEGADTAVVSPSTVGENVFTYTVTNDFGCTFDTTITITVNPGIPSPLNIIGDDEICIGTLAQISAPAGYTGYTWSNGFTGQSISVGAGEYTVTVFSGDCSLESEPFTVAGVPSPSPEITGPGFSCGGALAGLSTAEEYASYLWSNGSTSPNISAGTGAYTVTVTNGEGCSGTSDVFNVVVGSDPQAAYSTDPVSPQGIGTTVDFTDLSQGNGSPIVAWEWNLGLTGATSSSPSPTYTYDTPGEYPITLTVSTADGCESTISGTFVILPEDIIIPNVFTPNGDGNNEFFEIQNGQYYENTLSVFNRWGQEVFETKNYRNGWRATDLPDGTYYYIFTTTKDGKEYTGHVTILR